MTHRDDNPDNLRDASVVPHVVYLLLAALLLGTCGFVSASNMITDPPNRDIWQHAAAIRALMENLAAPANPFVATEETSRHFHPLWVAFAAMALLFDLTVWQTLTLASYAAMALLALGVFLFSPAYFASPWAPAVLLIVLLAGWIAPIQHTGFHSFQTLLYGAAYPATFLIGFSLILWAVIIGAMRNPRRSLLLVPLVALMVATHQLGAAIGLVGAGALVLFWPTEQFKTRITVSVAVLLGMGLSVLWPYYSAIDLILTPGNSSWDGGPNYYNPSLLLIILTPAIFGVLGFKSPNARAMLFALFVYVCLFLIGLTGAKVASRFLMPIALVLHIGLTAFILEKAQAYLGKRKHAVPIGTALSVLIAAWIGWSFWSFQQSRAAQVPFEIGVYDAAQTLTEDIPDHESVAAYELTAWPVVATGQRVVSVPWPEPGIADLAERQPQTRSLFEKSIDWDARVELGKSLGVRTLLVDRLYFRKSDLEAWSKLAVSSDHVGAIWRFDLYE